MSENSLRADLTEFGEFARTILDQEVEALESLKDQLDPRPLQQALEMILGCEGMVMVVGAGTSGSIARRLAHALTCSGARSMYLDPGQSQHGYSGVVTDRDVLIAISRGGETDNVNYLLRLARKRGAGVIGIMEDLSSTLAQLSDAKLEARVAPENDAYGILPLASTLTHAAVGDILCAALLSVRGYTAQEFAELHPGGAVGKQLSAGAGEAERLPRKDGDLTALRSLKGLVLDMDGVLWHGEKPLPGLTEFFAVLRRCDIGFTMATNNPSQKPKGFAEKALSMGIEVSPEDVITSGVATVHYLKNRYPPGSRVHVIGEPALKEQIAEAGFVLADDDVVAVVVALDRSMTYETVERGTLLIRGGAEFIGTNPDPFYPTERGILPGSGTMVATLAASTGREPVIMGKPQRWTFDLALERMGLGATQVASVGDRLDTDISGGQRAGMKTILLLSGIATTESLATSPIRPTWVFSGIAELARALDG